MPKLKEDSWEVKEKKRIEREANCDHKFYIVRCSLCSKIMSDEKLEETQEYEEHYI